MKAEVDPGLEETGLEENLFCSKGCNYEGTCLLIPGNFDSFDNQESLLSVFSISGNGISKKKKVNKVNEYKATSYNLLV